MIKDMWPNVRGRVNECLRKCGIILKEVWTND